jgi:hypothetical protein
MEPALGSIGWGARRRKAWTDVSRGVGSRAPIPAPRPRLSRLSLPSRLWLFLAFLVAFGVNPAKSESAPKLIAVVLDQATVVKLPPGASTLIIGNPMIADVTMLKSGAAMVVTGKGYGQTNVIALDVEGTVLLEDQLRVLPAKTVVVLQNGTSHVSYSCNPDCMPTVQLGDDPKSFNDAGGEISSRNSYATGASGGGK